MKTKFVWWCRNRHHVREKMRHTSINIRDEYNTALQTSGLRYNMQTAVLLFAPIGRVPMHPGTVPEMYWHRVLSSDSDKWAWSCMDQLCDKSFDVPSFRNQKYLSGVAKRHLCIQLLTDTPYRNSVQIGDVDVRWQAGDTIDELRLYQCVMRRCVPLMYVAMRVRWWSLRSDLPNPCA